MISILTALVFLIWLGRAVLRRPAFFLVGIFLIWQFLLKILSIVYLDLAGPIYSDEVLTEVGGGGSATPLLVFFVWIPLAFMYYTLRPRAGMKPPITERNLHEASLTMADLVVTVLGVFVAVMYVDMFIRGSIPFFVATDRFEYNGGVFHKFFLEFLFLFTFLLGYVFARGRMLTGVWDLRCVALLFAYFVYLFLAGHRFGAFYVMVSFMCLAYSASFFAKGQGWPVAPVAAKVSVLQIVARSRFAVGAAAVAVVGLLAAAIINNLFFVRDYGDAAGEELFQRLLVQPVHLYWLTWDRLFAGEISDVGAAIDFMFRNPLDATRNTGIQYLMFLTLGEDRSALIIDQNSQFAGGYPEIIIELGGIWIATLLAVIGAVFVAYLYRLCVLALCRGHLLTSILAIYVCFGFLVFYVGGMLNFLLAWTYWLKIVALLAAMIIERLLDRAGLRLFPWVLLARRTRPQDQPAGA